jgi:hypothetical protein
MALDRRRGLPALAVAMLAVRAGAADPAPAAAAAQDDPARRHVYYTGGVHNDLGCQPPEKQ